MDETKLDIEREEYARQAIAHAGGGPMRRINLFAAILAGFIVLLAEIGADNPVKGKHVAWALVTVAATYIFWNLFDRLSDRRKLRKSR